MRSCLIDSGKDILEKFREHPKKTEKPSKFDISSTQSKSTPTGYWILKLKTWVFKKFFEVNLKLRNHLDVALF